MTHKRFSLVFAGIMLAYLVYAGAFIYRCSVVVPASSYIPEAKRYYVLFDDAMISMRYAKNLANGDGLVWNPGGERVEGFTNPLWVGYMAIFHLMDIDESKTSAAISISGAVLMALNLLVIKQIADRVSGGRPVVAWGAAVFTAFYLPLNIWTLQGTEVSILTLLVSLAVWAMLRALDQQRFSVLPYLLLGFGTLIRLDMAVPFGAAAVFLFFADRPHRLRHVVAAPLILLGFVIPQELWRRWYYDDWFPNTYYLKMDGFPFVPRLVQGLEVTGRFFAGVGVLPFGLYLFRRDKPARLLGWMFVAQVLYNIYVGGDAWEWHGGANRYLSIAIPLFFVLLWITLAELYFWLIESARRLGQDDARFRLNPAAVRIGLAALAAFLFIDFNYTYGTPALEELLLIKKPMFAGEYKMRIEQAQLLKALTTPDATVTVAAAGMIPYFADRQYVDLLGKSDKVIGRQAVNPQALAALDEFKPGHMKWDYAYSIGQLQPDVVLELWVRAQDAGPYLDSGYHKIWFPPANRDVWFKMDSPHVYWDRIWGSGG